MPQYPICLCGAAQETIARLDQFRRFYMVVISYIYFTRIAVYIISVVAPYRLTWVGDFLQEVATLCFFTYTGRQLCDLFGRWCFWCSGPSGSSPCVQDT